MRSLLVITSLLLVSFLAVPASAGCSSINRGATVPAEGATATAVLTQCQSSYQDPTFKQDSWWNTTALFVNDPTTGANVQIYDNAGYDAFDAGSWQSSSTQHSYSLAVAAQGSYVGASASSYQNQFTGSPCGGYFSVQLYQSSPAQGTNFGETLPVGGNAPAPCVPQEELNLLP